MHRHSLTTFAIALAATWAIGCGETKTEPVKTAATAKPAASAAGGHEEHSHGAGPHGGSIDDWGGKYHLEFVVDHEKKQATAYILGLDAKTPVPLKADKLTFSGTNPKVNVELSAKPLEGEADGMSSRFVGTDDKFGVEGDIAGKISGEADGAPYEGDVKHNHAHDHEHGHDHGKGEKHDHEKDEKMEK